MEQYRVDRSLEVLVGDELQHAPAALGHLGALRDFRHTAEIPLRDDLDDVPLIVGVERLLDVRRVQQCEHLPQVVAGLDGQGVDIAVSCAVERVTQIESDALHGGDAAEWPLFDQLPATDHLAYQQVAEILRQRRHEADQLTMEVAVDHSAGRRCRCAIVEGAAISDLTVAPLVAKRLPFLEQIETARARPALNVQLAEAEELQQHVDGLEHLRTLVLVDEIKLGRGVQLARHHAVVKVRLNIRIGHLLKGDRTLAAKAEQVEESVAARGRVGPLLHKLGKAVLELLLVGAALLRRNPGELIADKAVPQPLDRFGMLDGHLSAPELKRFGSCSQARGVVSATPQSGGFAGSTFRRCHAARLPHPAGRFFQVPRTC